MIVWVRGREDKGWSEELTSNPIPISRKHSFRPSQTFFELIDALPNLFKPLIRFPDLTEGVQKVVANAIEQTGWTCVLHLIPRNQR